MTRDEKVYLIVQEAIDIIKHWEGLSFMWYLCPSGYPTIGWGHKKNINDNFGAPITIEFADQLLAEDLDKVMIEVETLTKSVVLNDNQFGALVSFVFNIGSGNFASSTMLKLLKQGKFDQAGDELLKWVKGTIRNDVRILKVVLPGLVKRRTSERKLFNK